MQIAEQNKREEIEPIYELSKEQVQQLIQRKLARAESYRNAWLQFSPMEKDHDS